jgi:hypothetical protein
VRTARSCLPLAQAAPLTATLISPDQVPSSGLDRPREIPCVRGAHILDDPFSSSLSRARHTSLLTKLQAASPTNEHPILDTSEISENEDLGHLRKACPHISNVPLRKRKLIVMQDRSLSDKLSEGGTGRLFSSPADIEGKFEYVKPEETRYGDNVPADRTESP